MSISDADPIMVKFNPIEEIELFLLSTDWSSDRIGENEIVIGIKGNYCEYNTTIHWNPNQDILHFAFSFSVGLSKEPLTPQKEMSVLKLLASLNETMAVGHYDLWREENSIVWRYGQIFSEEECHHDYFVRIFRLAIDTCERNYSAFQFVLWAGQSPHEAIQNIMFETVGEA